MKNQLYKWLLIAVIAMSFTAASMIAAAYQCEWRNGQKICWHNGERHCRWVNGYWHHGYYYRGHKVCWYNRY